MRLHFRHLLFAILVLSASTVSGDPQMLKEGAVKKLTVSSPPADDSLLVPGWRAGPIHLGMSTAQLLKAAKREPDQTFARGLHFVWSGTYVQTWEDGTVGSISVGWNRASSGMKTAEGLGLGSSQIAIAAALGQPDWRTILSGTLLFCYKSGIAFEFAEAGHQSGAVQIHIVTKARAKWLCSSK